MSSYSVGQILYLLSEKTMKVFPAQVVEQVVRNSLSGKQITYTIMLPDKNRTLTELEGVNARVFEKSSDLQKFMFDNAKASIEGMIKTADSLKSCFENREIDLEENKEDEAEEQILESSVQKEEREGTIKVDMGNGIKANIKIEDLEKIQGIKI